MPSPLYIYLTAAQNKIRNIILWNSLRFVSIIFIFSSIPRISVNIIMGKGPGLYSDIGKRARGLNLHNSGLWFLLFQFFFLNLCVISFLCGGIRSSLQGLQQRPEVYNHHLFSYWSGKVSFFLLFYAVICWIWNFLLLVMFVELCLCADLCFPSSSTLSLPETGYYVIIAVFLLDFVLLSVVGLYWNHNFVFPFIIDVYVVVWILSDNLGNAMWFFYLQLIHCW